MAEGKLPSADFEDVPLPGAEAPDFDLSDETTAVDGNGVQGEPSSEEGSYGEPEGIFSLFDGEFPEEVREPIEPGESTEFDREFSESFDHMFTAVKGDGSAPLFEAAIESSDEPIAIPNSSARAPIGNTEVEDLPPAVTRAPELDPDELKLDEFNLEEEDEVLPTSIPTGDEDPRFLKDQLSDLPELILDMEPDEPEPSLPDFEEGLPDLGELGDDEETETALSWEVAEDGLEELNFDDSDDDELFGEDLGVLGSESADESGDDSADGFDEFAKMALGFEDGNADEAAEDDEEDDFVVEELSSADELDPFEDIAIMSSEDVAKYEPTFGDDGLKFEDEKPLEDDPDPFSLDGDSSEFSSPEEGFDPLDELDPFGEEAAELAESAEKDKQKTADPEADTSEVDEDKPREKKERKKPSTGAKGGSAIAGILLLPWRIYSSLTSILFGVIESLIGLLGKIPLLGIPFKLLGSVLSAIPMALKRIIVLAVIAAVVWGGSSLVNGLIPKPSADIELPDSGSASFVDVALRDGSITGRIENTGDVNLQVFPDVKIYERQIFNPGSWFNPVDLGNCGGDLVEVDIDGTAEVSYSCEVAADGIVSVVPSLKE